MSWSWRVIALLVVSSLALVASTVVVLPPLAELDALIGRAAPELCRTVSRRVGELVLPPGAAMAFAGFLAVAVAAELARSGHVSPASTPGGAVRPRVILALTGLVTAVVVAGFGDWTRRHGMVLPPVITTLAAGALVAFAARGSDVASLFRVLLVTTLGVIAVSGVVSGIELFVRAELLEAVATASEGEQSARVDVLRNEARVAGLELKRLSIVPIIAAMPALVRGRRLLVAALRLAPGRLAIVIAVGLLFGAPVQSSVALKARWETACLPR